MLLLDEARMADVNVGHSLFTHWGNGGDGVNNTLFGTEVITAVYVLLVEMLDGGC
jgi:hypothetical protein